MDPISPRKRPEVIGVVLANPSMFLYELCSEIKELYDIDVCPSILCRLLRVHGMTRKRIRQVALQVALQRCDHLRGAFTSQCLFFRPETWTRLVVITEVMFVSMGMH